MNPKTCPVSIWFSRCTTCTYHSPTLDFVKQQCISLAIYVMFRRCHQYVALPENFIDVYPASEDASNVACTNQSQLEKYRADSFAGQ